MRRPPRIVADVARPGIAAAQTVFDVVPSVVVRVAALVEIAAAAATLARTLTNRYRLDPTVLTAKVTDPTDLYAVLGRGRWLPTMTRRITAAGIEPLSIGQVLPAVVPHDRVFLGKGADDAVD